MNKRRLLKLADLLEADAKNKKGIKFDLDVVAAPAGGQRFVGDQAPTLDCNTAACAVGLAAISGAFADEGLGYEIRNSGFLEPTFDGSIRFGDADRRFFDLEEDEHTFLFMPDSYTGTITGARGERKVAKRIRDLVAGKISVPTDL